tara:strand:- start:57 stop:440 length:384 start_codon:yes stop_codon:yes gene_type:complete
MTDKDRQRQQKLIRKKKMQEKAREWVKGYLLTHPCVDCGNTDIRVLEFDHRIPSEKSFIISRRVAGGVSLKTLAEEVAKCDIRCANCHRIRTKEERHFGPNDKRCVPVVCPPKKVEIFHKKLNGLSD